MPLVKSGNPVVFNKKCAFNYCASQMPKQPKLALPKLEQPKLTLAKLCAREKQNRSICKEIDSIFINDFAACL
jgi:hypothetical protein